MAKETETDHSGEVALGTFWSLAGTFFTKIVSFLTIVYVARVVSQDDVGLFYLSLGIVGLFGVWRDFGLPNALLRYIPYYESRGEEGKVRGLLKTTYAVNLVSGALLAAITYLAADAVGAIYGNPGLPSALRLMSAFMLLELLFRINFSYLQGISDIKGMQLAINLQAFLRLMLTVALFQLYGPSLYALIASFLFSYLAASILTLPMVLGKSGVGDKAGEGMNRSELINEIIPFGIMLTVLQTFNALVSSTDKVLLGYLIPAGANEAVAVYAIATALAINLMVFPSSVGNIFMPMISRMVGKNDLGSVRKVLATAQRWVLFITIPMAAVMLVFSSEMLSIFYGKAYAGGASAMAIFLAGLVVYSLAYTFSLALAAMRLVKLELKIAFAAGVLNVLFNLLFIPQMGMEGSALASALSFTFATLVFGHYAKKILGFQSPGSVYRILACGAAVCAIIFLLKPVVALAAGALPPIGSPEMQPYAAKIAYLSLLGFISALSFAFFGALSLALKCFESEDVALMKKVAKKAAFPEQLILFAEKMMLWGVSGSKR